MASASLAATIVGPATDAGTSLDRRIAGDGSHGRPDTTPAGLTITSRDRRFGRNRDEDSQRWWVGGDPYATALYNSLSVSFPRGEAYFVESVRQWRDGADPRLAADIRAFIQQEVTHSREHGVFNRRLAADGYDISRLEASVQGALDMTRSRGPVAMVIVTAALEHFTGILSHELLANPVHLADADPEEAAMWRWHAGEEIEHKGVAYDTMLHATRDWGGFKRWRKRALVMILLSWTMVYNRYLGALDLLEQDGITGARAKWRMLVTMFARPGLFGRSARAWLGWFRPGFHPWQVDDRHLIARAGMDQPVS